MAGDGGVVRAPVVGQVAFGGGAALAGHAAVADGAEQPGPQRVAPSGAGGGGFGVAGAAVPPAHLLGLIPGLPVHQGRVGGFRGPDPFPGRGPLPGAAFGLAAAHDLMAGVLRVGQDLIDQGQRPGPRRRDGVPVRVLGQPPPDGRLPEPVHHPPPVDLGHDRREDGVGDQPRFGAAFRRLDRVGMRMLFRQIPGGDFPQVPAGQGVFPEPGPYFFAELEPVPFRDALFHPPDQNGRRVDPGDIKRLVGGE